MDKALQTFEDLVRRAIAPSMTFFVLWAAAELVRLWLTGEWVFDALVLEGVTRTVEKRGDVSIRIFESRELLPMVEVVEKIPAVFTVLAILAIVGLSYALAAAQQVLFDNRLKTNFGRKGPLVTLRKRVINRLNQEAALSQLGNMEGSDLSKPASDREPIVASDYLLYEILGGIDTINTRPFVDSAKALGIFFVSVMVLSLGYLVMFIVDMNIAGLTATALIIFVAWWYGLEATRTQYRMRAIRLYVNFLAMPSDFIWRRLLKEDWPEPKKKEGS